MAESIMPSPELQGLLADLRQFEIPVDAIQKIEIKPEKIETEPKDGTIHHHIDVSNITWPAQQEALVKQVMEKAIDESILQLAAKSKEWRAEIVLLRKGSFLPVPGEICLIIPLIRASGSHEKASASV
ncbi:hypothetical protein NPX13_g8109 [Xylaria arbuscula]|uniref:Uncharacterized protein n=1 Tax=Xylaria arbuscula TaxID=114810 RepID=A0A9W8N979_9PEZI|nr:hypothetical protein NPX13_g8109 [Xylaria arbuscula]